VALVDIRMPRTHTDEGLVAAQQIRAEHPLGRRPGPVPVRRARLRPTSDPRSNPNGFDIATVVDALRRIVAGETVIDPTIVSPWSGDAAGKIRWPTLASGNERSSGWSPRACLTGPSPPG
jgi:hypothetical protein